MSASLTQAIPAPGTPAAPAPAPASPPAPAFAPTSPPAPAPAFANKEVDGFDEFDPRGSFSGTELLSFCPCVMLTTLPQCFSVVQGVCYWFGFRVSIFVLSSLSPLQSHVFIILVKFIDLPLHA